MDHNDAFMYYLKTHFQKGAIENWIEAIITEVSYNLKQGPQTFAFNDLRG